MGSLKELLARVEALTGPDREVDAEIAVALDCYTEAAVRRDEGWVWRHGQTDRMAKAPEYTASIDHAVALVEKRLPGWAWHVSRIVDVASRYAAGLKDCEARLWVPAAHTRHEPTEDSVGAGDTPPLAILAALLLAELSRSDQGGGNA